MNTAVATRARSDIVFAALLSGAYASATTALLFLIIDASRGQPLYTPSVLGEMVLLGQDPNSVGPLRLDMVALYSLVHLVAFVLIGGLATALYQAWENVRPPVVMATVLTVLLTGGVLLMDRVAYPGLAEAVGPLALIAGNIVAATTMTWVVRSGLSPEPEPTRTR